MPTPHFKKGYDPRRNLKGRPKSPFEEIRKLVKNFLMEKAGELDRNGKKKVIRNIEVMIARAYKMAMNGDLNAMKTLLEYGYGKVPNQTELSGPDGGPVRTAIGMSQEDIDKIDAAIMGTEDE